MKPEHKKPGYSTSRQQMWFAFWLAWAVILSIVAGGLMGKEKAVDLASIVVPSMVVLIGSMLGIHRFSGAMDFRSAALAASRPPAPYDPRADPADQGEVQ